MATAPGERPHHHTCRDTISPGTRIPRRERDHFSRSCHCSWIRRDTSQKAHPVLYNAEALLRSTTWSNCTFCMLPTDCRGRYILQLFAVQVRRYVARSISLLRRNCQVARIRRTKPDGKTNSISDVGKVRKLLIYLTSLGVCYCTRD